MIALTLVASGPAVLANETAGIELLHHTTAIRYQRAFPDGGAGAWHERVPQAQIIAVPCSSDGSTQRAIWYDSGSERAKPLLVVLHSWGASYKQNLDIPFAEFAVKNDWVFIHPDFRGPNLRPEATASDLAVQDVIDAVAFARERAHVDPGRIYLVGYSGGGMKALVLAGRHPELWAGVVAWGAIYDIADWYRHDGKDQHYNRQIAASCGGSPRPGTAAEADCKERSPSVHLENGAGRVPVLIAHGLQDTTVPVRHALDAYDALAAPEDRFSVGERAQIDGARRIPAGTPSARGEGTVLFDQAGVPVALERSSRRVTLVLFEGGHDMAYNATLAWLSERRR